MCQMCILYEKFIKVFRKTTINLSKFVKLWPNWYILAVAKGRHTVCLKQNH